MIYKEVKPHLDLSHYIDAFWTVEGAAQQRVKTKILPDNCVDLVFNLGEKCQTDNGTSTISSRKTYLVGTMTTFKDINVDSSNKLVGIRFKPSAFSSFYEYSSLHEVKDLTIEFDQALSPDIDKIEKNPVGYLNAFLLKRLIKRDPSLFKVIDDIEIAGGKISIDMVAKKNYTTMRQLERNFKKHIGIGPKEFANVVRFRTAIFKINNNTNGKSLLDIAFECGYYDHAHLGNEIKKYAGIVPSKF